jgi:hypothetical protein
MGARPSRNAFWPEVDVSQYHLVTFSDSTICREFLCMVPHVNAGEAFCGPVDPSHYKFGGAEGC